MNLFRKIAAFFFSSNQQNNALENDALHQQKGTSAHAKLPFLRKELDKKIKTFISLRIKENQARATKRALRDIVGEHQQLLEQLFEKMNSGDLDPTHLKNSQEKLLIIEAVLLLFDEKCIEQKKLSKSTAELEQELKALKSKIKSIEGPSIIDLEPIDPVRTLARLKELQRKVEEKEKKEGKEEALIIQQKMTDEDFLLEQRSFLKKNKEVFQNLKPEVSS